MAEEHKHGPHCHHEPHIHSESCGHNTIKEKEPHAFSRGDLLRNYQMLERIAVFMPPELLNQPLVTQLDSLVGAFEHAFVHSFSHDQCDHDHDEGDEECDHQGHEHVHEHADIDPYNEALKDDLEYAEYRKRIQAGYKPLHSDLYKFSNWPVSETLMKLVRAHPAFKVYPEDVKPTFSSETHPLIRLMPIPKESDLKGDQKATIEKEIKSLLKEVAPGIFLFDFLPSSFCEKLLEEIDHFEAWCKETNEPVRRPNSMNNYGAILDDFGFEGCLDDLVSQVMNVLSAVVYPYIGATLDHHHGFEVAYEIGKDRDLDMHVDDSEVTLNVCLGREFTDGELFFAGARCTHHQRTTRPTEAEAVAVVHKVGQACLHIGRQRHAATPISSGERYNLILWCRSSKFRRLDTLMDCPDWCPVSEVIDAQEEANKELKQSETE